MQCPLCKQNVNYGNGEHYCTAPKTMTEILQYSKQEWYRHANSLETKKIFANVIADLYEMRAHFIHPLKRGEMQDTTELVQYQFLSSLIANFSHMYAVDERLIQEVLREREIFKRNIYAK